MNINRSIFRRALLKSLPIFFSYLFLGCSYGILMSEAGLGWGWTLLISTTVYTGAFQFVLTTFLSSGAGILTVAVTALLINSRQIFYSLTLLEDFREYRGWRRLYMIHGITDETFAVDMTLERRAPESKPVMLLIAAFSHSYWILGSVLGSVIGQLLPVSMEGIDFCMTALFLIIFVDQWEKAADHRPALVGLGIGVVYLQIFG